jgi:hypothetical protein
VSGTAVVVDRRYVLAAAGLLAGEHPVAASGLVRGLLAVTVPASPAG